MQVLVVVARHHASDRLEADTLAEARSIACAQWEWGESLPRHIEDADGNVVEMFDYRKCPHDEAD